MLEACVQSASHIICTLSTLHKHHLLGAIYPLPTCYVSFGTLIYYGFIGSFLFFDLEHGFSAAFVLIIAEAIIPSAVPDLDHEATIHTIFEYLIRRGSVPAQHWENGLDHLKSLLSPLSAENTATPMADQNDSAAVDLTPGAETILSDLEVELSASNMLSIAEQLDASETMTWTDFLSPAYWPWSTTDETAMFSTN